MGSDMIIAAQNSGGGGAFNLLLLLAVPLVFYFLLIRPQSKRRKEQVAMQNSIEPGAHVITTSGMHATVVEIDDDGIILEIADGVEARFVRQAVMNVVKGGDTELELDEDDELDGDEDKPAGASIDLSKDDTDKDGKVVADDELDGAEKAAPKATASEKP